MELIKKALGYWKIGLGIGVLLLILGMSTSKKEEMENIELEPIIPVTLKIDIKGAVNQPGVYEFSDSSRVEDAIKASGGFTAEADQSGVNLSEKLVDEMILFIPKKVVEEKKEVVEEKTEPSISIPNQTKTGKISINTASQKELETLTGIGSTKAQAIITYRNQNGRFKSLEDLKNVSGIGTATFEKIKNQIQL